MPRISAPLILMLAAFTLSGCAGSAPSASFKRDIAESSRICPTDVAKVKLTAAEGVPLEGTGLTWFQERLQSALDNAKSKATCVTSGKRNFILEGKITQYEAGSSFARLMLAGLGQMHLDGDFTLNLETTGTEALTEFSASKTFAWGGAYGASATLATIEPAFFEAITTAVVAKAQEK